MTAERLRRRINEAWITILLAAFGFVALYPVYFVIVSSLKNRREYVSNLFGLPHQWTLVNYAEVFDRFNLWRALLNSILTTAGGVVICVVLALVLAYAVTKMRLPFRNFIFVFVIGTLVLPVQTILFPLYQTLIDLRFVGKYWGLMLAFATFGLPLTVYLLAAYFKGVPDELLDAARVDGLSHGQIVRRLMVPLAMPAVATVAVIDTLHFFNDLLLPMLILPSSRRTTMMVHIMLFRGQNDLSVPLLSAGLFIAMLPVLIAYLLGQKQLIKGLTAGAVK
jgi:ABC-type glycerol-3-phosphate transport system permease component